MINQKDYEHSTLKWTYSKDGSGSDGDDRGWVDGLVVGTDLLIPQPGKYAEALDCDLTITTGGDLDWFANTSTNYYDDDAVKSGSIDDDETTWIKATFNADDGEKVSFYWKVSSEENDDHLKLYIDDDYQEQISGDVDWEKKSYTLSGTGEHTLEWRYVKDSKSMGVRP